MNTENGWKPLPTSLKILFVIFGLGVLSSIYSLFSVSEGGYSLFSFELYGLSAILLLLLISIVGSSVILLGFWKRYSWVWKYTLGYLIFMILNGILSMLNLSSKVSLIVSQLEISIPGFDQILYIILVGIILSILINLWFLIIVYRNDKYFLQN